MKLVWLEGKRIVKRGWVALCFPAFLALGIWISGLMLERSFEEKGCSVEEYLEVSACCRGMTLQDATDYLGERAETALQAMEIYPYFQTGQLSYEEAAEQLVALGYGEIPQEELSFSVLRAERTKYQLVLDEVRLLLQYEDRMKEIRLGGGGLSGISFFGGDDYVALTQEKAMRDYAGLQVELDIWQPNASAREFLENRVMDGLIFLFLTVVVLLLYMEEKEKGYAALTAAARGGRQHFYVQKAAVLFGLTLFTVLVYEGTLLVWYVWRLGGIVRNVPIQSIADFMMCSRGFSVGTVIILTVILKVLLFYILALVLSAVACRMRKLLPLMCVTVLIVLLSAVWERTANINDRLGWLTCLNPLVLTDVAGMITGYRQVPVFGRPVSAGTLSGLFAGGVGLVSLGVGLFFYARTRKRESFSFRRPAVNRHRRIKGGAFRLELKKVMISYRVLVMVLLVVAACAAGYFVSKGKAMSRQEKFYQEYMEELNGPLTPEKESFILEERERFRRLEVIRDELLMQGGDQALLLSRIESEMMKKTAFDLVERQYARVQETGGVFLYETGYLYLMGLAENESGHINVFLGLLILTLILPFLSWIDLSGGADGLVRTTAGGRSRLLKLQYAVCFLVAALLFGSVSAEDAAEILRQYGSCGLLQAAGNISQLEGFLSGCSVGAYLLLVYVIRLLGVATAALFSMACLYRCRDYLSAVLMYGMFLVLPDLLFMNGFSFMKGYFINALLHGEECLLMIRDGEAVTILLVLLQMGLCIGWSFGILRKEVKRR